VNGPVPLSGIPSDLSLMLHGGMCRLEHLMTVSPQIKHDVMYGVLQATSGNENVGFPFLCQSTYKRRTVFSFPPIVSCRVWVLTMMCLSPACLISEFPPPPLFFCTLCKLPFTRAMLCQAFTFTHDIHAVFKIFNYFSFPNTFPA